MSNCEVNVRVDIHWVMNQSPAYSSITITLSLWWESKWAYPMVSVDSSTRTTSKAHITTPVSFKRTAVKKESSVASIPYKSNRFPPSITVCANKYSIPSNGEIDGGGCSVAIEREEVADEEDDEADMMIGDWWRKTVKVVGEFWNSSNKMGEKSNDQGGRKVVPFRQNVYTYKQVEHSSDRSSRRRCVIYAGIEAGADCR